MGNAKEIYDFSNIQAASKFNPVQNHHSPQFLDETLKFWQDYADRPLTSEDARQIVENVAEVFSLLAEWDAKEQSLEATVASTGGGEP